MAAAYTKYLSVKVCIVKTAVGEKSGRYKKMMNVIAEDKSNPCCACSVHARLKTQHLAKLKFEIGMQFISRKFIYTWFLLIVL
jgi:hypothetical protein